MDPERWKIIVSLYHSALERSPAKRSAFVMEACGEDEELRRQVNELIGKPPGVVEDPTLTQVAFIPKLGPYKIEAVLGEGGMGQVFRAVDTRLGRTVAIKLVRKEFADRQDFRHRLELEARATSALNHPHICTLYDIGEQDGAPYLVMEFIEGETLGALIHRDPLPAELLARYGAQAAEALAAAHARGIIHRDLKPANLMVTAHGIKILDFGLAKFASSVISPAPSGALTATEVIVGTPAYMSPEQARGEELDARTDIFSLGAVLYEAATGRVPFRGQSALATLHEITTATPTAPTAIRPDLPAAWDGILAQALAKEKQNRYQSAEEFLHAVDALRTSARALVPQSAIEPPLDPFVGREQEILRLNRLVDGTAGGSGKVVLISGEPGIGKTALAAAFLRGLNRDRPEVLVGRGACVEQYGIGEAYLPFLGALSDLFSGGGRERVVGLLRRYAPTWCLQFPSVFSGASIEQLQREAIGATKERMLRELGDAVGELTAVSPMVLFLEDLHWADPASIDLLRYLGHRAKRQRLLLIGTARPGEPQTSADLLKTCTRELQIQGACEEIALQTLAQTNIAEYLNGHFSPNTFPPELTGLIHRKTEGHPLFAIGVIQILVERSDIRNHDGLWSLEKPVSEIDLDVPESVRSMIGRKLDLLDREDLRALQYASVEGEEFLSTVLAATLESGELELEERLDRLDRVHHLIRTRGEEVLPDGAMATRYRFAHELYQNTLYNDLLAKRRVLLHRQAGESLARCYGDEAPRIATVLATHFERGREFLRAVEFLILAGDNAVALSSNAVAVEHYGRAGELLANLPALSRSGHLVTIYPKRGTAYIALGRPTDAEADFTAMLHQATGSGNAEAECAALTGLANVANYMRQPAQMGAYAERALAVAESIGHRALWSEATGHLAASLMVVGRVAEAHTRFEQAISVSRPLRHFPALLHALTYRGVAHFFQSNYGQAEDAEMEASRLAVECRDGFYLALSLTYLGFSRANQGRISEGLAALNQALDLGRRNGNQIVLSRAPNGIGWIHREVGDLRQAIEYNEGCVEAAHRARASEAEANALINLVHDYSLAGQCRKAQDAMETVNSVFDHEVWNRWRFFDVRYQAAAAEHWLIQGNPDRAGEYGQRLLVNSRHYGVPKYIAVAHRLLGQAALARGDDNLAEEEFNRSLEPFANNPAPLVEWRNHAALGQMLAGSGRPAAARESFRRSARVVRQIAASITDTQLCALFLDTPEVRMVLAGASNDNV